jgi:hypothetical protein
MIVEANNGSEMLYNDEGNVENARRDMRINTYIIRSLTKPGKTNPGDKTLNNNSCLRYSVTITPVTITHSSDLSLR